MPRPEPTSLPETVELFERYGAMVFRRCREILKSEDEAADATQEVYLRVHQKRAAFRAEALPSTWLYGAATLHCLQRLRNRDRRRQKLELLAELPADTPAPAEDHLTLLRLLDGQADDVRLMIYLRYVDGLTMEEVAEVVGRSRKTVAQRVKAFVLAAKLDLEWEGETP